MYLHTEVIGKPSPETWDFLSREDEGLSFRERKNNDMSYLKCLSFIELIRHIELLNSRLRCSTAFTTFTSASTLLISTLPNRAQWPVS